MRSEPQPPGVKRGKTWKKQSKQKSILPGNKVNKNQTEALFTCRQKTGHPVRPHLWIAVRSTHMKPGFLNFKAHRKKERHPQNPTTWERPRSLHPPFEATTCLLKYTSFEVETRHAWFENFVWTRNTATE